MTKHTKNNKLDWLTFALDVLITKGPDHLKIAPLCELKGVTKGSFYHHFTNRDIFIESLMLHWYESKTVAFIEQANVRKTAQERLQELDKIIANTDNEAELHIRAWALKNVDIRVHLQKIDSQRQAYLAECYCELGLDENTAKDIALMTYANFLGMQQVQPKPSIEEALRISIMSSKAFLPNVDLP